MYSKDRKKQLRTRVYCFVVTWRMQQAVRTLVRFGCLALAVFTRVGDVTSIYSSMELPVARTWQDLEAEQEVVETILPLARLGSSITLTDGRTSALLGEMTPAAAAAAQLMMRQRFVCISLCLFVFVFRCVLRVDR